MEKKFTLLVLLILLIGAEIAYGQICATPGLDGSSDISGQVNTYYPPAANTILTGGSTSVVLAAVPPDVNFNGGVNTYSPSVGGQQLQIHIGDLLLIIQMQNASIESANSNLYGSGVATSGFDGLGGTGYTSLGNTGLFEYVVATSDVPTTGGLLTFRGAGTGTGVVNTYLNTDYDPASATRGQRTFQVVRVPQYSNVKLVGNIAAPPFNGRVGGIIAFDVAGTMNFNGKTIDASARGFRGGFVYQQNSSGICDNTTYVELSTNTNFRTSGKGEGIVGSPKNMWDGFIQVVNPLEGMPGGSYGRGAAGNGGGGGNTHNAGGGGGGNGGYGGRGGTGYSCLVTPASSITGGRPGSTTGTPTPTRLIMGGGGGAGEVNNAVHGTSGGVGGGVILLNVGAITGSGIITTNGGDGQSAGWDGNGIVNDGAGGGGAGGTVYIKVSSPNLGASLTINAKGGAGGKAAIEGDEHGPGGGGGGGLVYYSAGAAGTVVSNVGGGAVGTTTNGTSTHGATAGNIGQSLTFTITSLPLYLQGGGVVCFPELSTTLSEANVGGAGTRMPGASVTYTLTISNKAGVGGAAGVLAELSLPLGISYQSVSVAYTGGTGATDSAISVTTNQGTLSKPRFGKFVVAPNGSVILTVLAKVDCNAATGTYSNTSAQVYYFDPTRSSTATIQHISPSPSFYSFPILAEGPISTSYTSGGAVPGVNYNGLSSIAEDVVVTDGVPVLSSSLSPPSIQSGSIFSYTPTSGFVLPSGGGVFTFSWSRTVRAGIIGSSTGTYTVNEALINTTTSTINVPYVYTLLINGCAKNSQTVTVAVNPSVLSIVGVQSVVNGGNTSTISVSLPSGVLAASTITLSLTRTTSGTAVAGTHYDGSSIPSSVTIPMGQNGISFTLITLSTNVIGQNVTLGLSSTLANYTINGTTVTIVGATINSVITTSSGSVMEGLSRTLIASLPSGVTTDGPLTLTISRIPAFPGGYSISPSVIVIPAGGNSVSFTVQTSVDGNVGDNSFSIAGNAIGFTSISGTLGVSDVNSSGGATTLTISSGVITETLSKTLTISLPGVVNTNTALTITLGHSTFPGGYGISSSVVIQAGQHSATFVVQTADDGNIGNQVFSITGTASVPNFVVMAGTLTVTDTSAMTLTISSGTMSETLSKVFTVSLPSGVNTNTALTVGLGHSPFPSGYSISSSVVIQAGQNSATFTVKTASDGNVGNNTFSMTGTVSLTNFTVLPGVLTVEDVDVRGGLGGVGSTNLTILSSSVTESLSKTLTVSLPATVNTNTALTITLGHGVFPAVVGYGLSTSVVIQAGQNSATFVAQTARDGNVGDNELSITGTVNPVGTIRPTDFTVSGGILTVLDVDVRGGITGTGSTSLTIHSGMVSETLSTILTVSLPTGVNTNTALTITLEHDTFPTGSYTIPSSVVIQAGQNSAPFVVQTASDGNVGDNVLGISGTVGATDFSMISGVLRVEDVDVRGGLYNTDVTILTISSDSVSEGLSSTLSVSLPSGVNTNTALTITLGHSAFPIGNYALSPSVVIQPGNNSATFVVQTANDGNIGDNELSITGTVSSSVTDFGVSGGSLTVTDTNSATLTISSGVVTETLSKTLTVSLSSGKTNTPLTVILGHSVFPNLGYDIPASVIIQSGESSTTIDIQTASDGNVGNNVFSVSGTATNHAVSSGTLQVIDVDVRGGFGGNGSTTLTISSGTISETLPIVLRVSLPTDVKTNTALTVTLGHSAFPVAGYTMPASVVIQSGQNSATFVVQTVGDGNIGDNVLSITGSVSESDFIISPGTLTVTNTGSTTLMISSGSLTETLSRTLTVSLPTGVVANTPVTVLLGHSVFPSGYSISSSVVIQSGQNSATFVIQSASDGNVGGNTFSITGTVSGTNFVVSPGTLQVSDVDVRGGFGGTGSTTLTISSRILIEGSSVTLDVSLPGTVKTNVPLGFTIQSTTPFLGGYTVNGGSVGGNTNFGLIIPAGEHSVSYTFRSASDGSILDNIFHLNGVSLVDYTFAIGTLTITNSDARQSQVLSITSANSLPIGGSLTASVTSTATLSSGGSVSYSITLFGTGSGSATIDPITHVISGLRGGTVLLRVSTAGDTNYSGALATQMITISKGTPTLLIGASTTTLRVGDVLSISSTSVSIAGSPASTGAITYRIVNTVGVGGATIDELSGFLKAEAAGFVVVEAIQGSDSNYYSPVPAMLTLTINKGPQSLTISSIDMMGLGGTIATVVNTTATDGRGGSISYGITNGSGSASVSPGGLITAIGAGTVTLTAITAGDTDYEGSSTSQTISIVSLSVSTTGLSLAEGTSGMITVSLNPANISLSRAVVFTFGGSAVSSGRFSFPTSVTLTSGQPVVSFNFSALADKVLYNDADLELDVTSVYLGSLSAVLSIDDATALNADNLVLTIGNGTIYNSDMISMTVSLPVGITTARAIEVTLSIGSRSELSLLAGSPKVSSRSIIPIEGHSGSFSVEATSLNKQPAVIVIEGISANMPLVKEGVVTVVNQKIDFAVAISNNGDGIDDCMHISGIENYPNNTVKVVDRRGRLVYEKTNFSSADCFAGYERGSLSKKLLDGMYYYIITINDAGTKDVFKGPLKIKH